MLEEIWKSQNKLMKIKKFYKEVESFQKKYDEKKAKEKIEDLKNKEIQQLLFDPFLRNINSGGSCITNYFQKI